MEGRPVVFRASALIVLSYVVLNGCQSDDASDASPDASAQACSETAQQWRQIAQGLSAVYRGSIADHGADVACRFDGSRFELSIELDSESDCARPSFCPTGAFDCDLSGTLRIDDAVANDVSGRVFREDVSAGPGLSVQLTSPLLGEETSQPLVNLQGARASEQLGGVGGQLSLSWKHESAAEGEVGWEACSATIEQIE